MEVIDVAKQITTKVKAVFKKGKPPVRKRQSITLIWSEGTGQAIITDVHVALAALCPELSTDPATRFSADILVCLDGGGATPWKLGTLRERSNVIYAVLGRDVEAATALSLGDVAKTRAFPNPDSQDVAKWVVTTVAKIAGVQ